MPSLSSAALLDAWTVALARPAPDRPLGILEAVLPDPSGSPEAAARLPVGRRDRLLLEVRARAFGPRMVGLSDCPECGQVLELELDSRELQETARAEEEPVRTLERDGYRVRYRPPVHEDLRLVAAGPPDPVSARRQLLSRCLLEVERQGEEADPAALPAEVEAAVVEGMREADPWADLRLELGCPACGHVWSVPLDVAGFFWTELDTWARRTLEEVHRMACAYGWQEEAILSLSQARRRHYLGMIGP